MPGGIIPGIIDIILFTVQGYNIPGMIYPVTCNDHTGEIRIDLIYKVCISKRIALAHTVMADEGIICIEFGQRLVIINV